jgi:hypothetical protein
VTQTEDEINMSLMDSKSDQSKKDEPSVFVDGGSRLRVNCVVSRRTNDSTKRAERSVVDTNGYQCSCKCGKEDDERDERSCADFLDCSAEPGFVPLAGTVCHFVSRRSF